MLYKKYYTNTGCKSKYLFAYFDKMWKVTYTGVVKIMLIRGRLKLWTREITIRYKKI